MSGDSTLVDVRRDAHIGAWGRRGGLTLLLLTFLAGGTGLFGVRARTITHRNGPYTLTVTYPRAARAGLDVPWRVHVSYPHAPKSITIAVTSGYFRIFETQGFYPDPDS